MSFRLEIRDTNFVIKEILDKEFFNLSWSYSRIGGCGEISFELPRKRFEERAITGEYNIRLYYRNPDTNSYELWYQGIVESKTPQLSGNTERIPFSGHGYQAQLSRIYINNVNYSSQEVSTIITNILDTYVIPNTDISYSASDISVTSYTPSSITFNESVEEAITKLSDLVGSREWGVDKDRNFFFKQRSSDVSFRFLSGTNITNFEDIQDFTKIVNRVYVQGAQSGGTYHFFGPYTDSLSKSKYNLREYVISNSSITTEDVGSQFATSHLTEFNEVSRKASCDLINYDALIEATVPLGLFVEIGKKTKYGQKKYGTFLYSGLVKRLINRVSYSYTDNNSLSIKLELGRLRSNFSEKISQIEYELEQQRSAAL